MDNKDYYIKLISQASDRYGNKLVMLMNINNKNSLYEITEDEAKKFYEAYIMESR